MILSSKSKCKNSRSAQLKQEVDAPEQPTKVVEDDEEDDALNRGTEKPRQWIIDRVDGNERVMGPVSRPYFLLSGLHRL